MNRLVARRVIADKYLLDRALAAGGMGSVWSAWNMQLDVPVAIKFMAPVLARSPELVARFEREARAAAQIRSPQVVQIFEHGVDHGLPFIVMELLEGEDLGARMRRVGRFPLDDTAFVVTEVCRALRRAHAMGIVHRDLKPANIFLAVGGDDDDEMVKVLDFGVVKSLAEAVSSGVTKTGELIGTPHYMSPEQARSTKTVDHRSDLWSLGIIAYRALTASLPFPNDDGIELLLRVCAEPMPPPSSIAPDLDPEVDAFFAKALAISPADRFQTAREMADAFNTLAGSPLSSRRASMASLADTGPHSTRVYTSQAFVYTSAPDDPLEAARAPSPVPGAARARVSPPPAAPVPPARGSSPSALPPVAPQARASSPSALPPVAPPARGSSPSALRPVAPQARRSSPSALPPVAPRGHAEGGSPRLSPPPEEPDVPWGEQPTRVSGLDPHRISRVALERGSPVVLLGSTSLDDDDPSDAGLLMDEMSTLTSGGLEQASGADPSSSKSARPRIALGAVFVAAVLGVVGLAVAARGQLEGPAPPASAAATSRISWASALGTGLTEAAPVPAVPSQIALAVPTAAPLAPPSDPAAPAASSTASADAAPPSSATSAAASLAPPHRAPPSSATSAVASLAPPHRAPPSSAPPAAAPATTTTSKGKPARGAATSASGGTFGAPRKEGGIGRRPTY